MRITIDIDAQLESLNFFSFQIYHWVVKFPLQHIHVHKDNTLFKI